MGLLGKIGKGIGKLFGSSTVQGAAKGGATGALLGGPIGGLVGAGIGGLSGHASGKAAKKGGGGLFGGSEDQARLLSNLDPKQKKLLSNYLSRLGKNQGRGFHVLNKLLQTNPPSKFRPEKFEFPEFQEPEEGFKYQELENPILEKWQSQILPSIMERFASFGNRNSSGLQQTLGQAGRGVARDLGTLYADILNKNALLRNENKWRGIGLRNSNAYNQANLNTQNAYNAAGLNSQNMFGALGVRQNALTQLLQGNQLGLNPGYNTPYIQGGSPGLMSSIAPAAGNLLGQIGLNSLQNEGGFLNSLFGGSSSSAAPTATSLGSTNFMGG